MTKDDDIHVGDRVEWISHGSTAKGIAEERLAEDTEAAGRAVRASDDDPQYRLRSAKSGRDAVHRPDALRKGRD
jgi:hypothetical protein